MKTMIKVLEMFYSAQKKLTKNGFRGITEVKMHIGDGYWNATFHLAGFTEEGEIDEARWAEFSWMTHMWLRPEDLERDDEAHMAEWERFKTKWNI